MNGTDITASIREQGSYTFVPTGNVTVEVTGVADTIAPGCDAYRKNGELEAVFQQAYFWLVFKETVDVTVVANDGGSGIDTANIW